MGVLDFFSREAGQQRRQRLDQAVGDFMTYITPPNLRPAASMVAQMNPVQGMANSMQAASVAFDPQQTAEARRRAALDMGVEMAMSLTPAALASRGYMTPAVAAMEGLLGGSPATAQIGESAGNLTADAIGAYYDVKKGDLGSAIRAFAPSRPMQSLSAGAMGDNGGPPLLLGRRDVGIYSPSVRAAEGLRQEKGTYEQMRSMLLKGGAKADELMWSGFDSTFKGRSSVTKDEIEEYLRDNTDMIGEVSNVAEGVLNEDAVGKHPWEMVDDYVERNIDRETQYFINEYLPDGLDQMHVTVSDLSGSQLRELSENTGKSIEELEADFSDYYVPDNLDDVVAPDDAVDYFYGDDFARELAEQSLREQAEEMDVVDLGRLLYGGDAADVSGVQYADYFTPGATDYTETRYTHEARPSNWREYESGHWGDDPNTVAHVRSARFQGPGETPVWHVGEIQSDWGQDARRSSMGIGSYDQESIVGEGGSALSTINQIQRAADDAVRNQGLLPQVASNMEMPDYRIRNAMRAEQLGRPDLRPVPHTDDSLQFIERSAPVESGLPLGYTGPEHLLSSEFMSTYGDKLRDARSADEAGKEIANQTFMGAPYVDTTSKWVDFALRQQLFDAIRSGADTMTISSPEMVRKMTFGSEEGQGAFYGNIVPRRLERIAQQYDKGATLTPTQITTGEGKEDVLGLKLSPEFIDKVARKGIPLWTLMGGVSGLGLLGAGQQDQQGLLPNGT